MNVQPRGAAAVLGAALSLAALSGCGSQSGGLSGGPADSQATSQGPVADTGSAEIIPKFELLTHCGIDHALIRGVLYRASPPLSDGNGHPPRGWSNTFQVGVMTVAQDGTATFTSGELEAHFVASPDYEPPMCS